VGQTTKSRLDVSNSRAANRIEKPASAGARQPVLRLKAHLGAASRACKPQPFGGNQ
jgi:hypothetical protein